MATALMTAATGTAVGLAPPAGAASAVLTGGGGSEWFVNDQRITSNGAPAGGTCDAGVPEAGAAVIDAEFPGQGDALDHGGLVFVGGTQVVGAMTLAGQKATFHASAVGGLTRQLSYEALASDPTLRVIVTCRTPPAPP